MNGADIQERRRTLSAQLAEMSVGEIKRFPLPQKRSIRSLTSMLKSVRGIEITTRADGENSELVAVRIK